MVAEEMLADTAASFAMLIGAAFVRSAGLTAL
jgi:hypothetical protein